jgi:hypothetical protein
VRDLLESDSMADDAGAVRAQWRAEEDEWSRAALERWEHGRGLDDVLRDCMQRGDVVTCAFADVIWIGGVVAVGIDVARIDTDGTPVDVRLAPDAPFVLRARAGTAPRGRGGVGGTLTTFRARLRELDGTALCIGTSIGRLEGRLRIGRDQVRLTDRDGGVAYVPTGSVGWMRPLEDD